MAVYVELVTDPFDAKFADKAKYATSSGAGLVSVRRPTRGIEIKDDTHAYIKLIRVDGVEIPMFDSSAEGGMSTANSNFILQSVQEQRMEKHQIVETFGDTYLFLFGEAPRFLQIQASLINSHDFNWKAEFLANYETYLRGTRAVEIGARTYLFYDQNIIEGYILNCQVGEMADTPHVIPLSFQFFVTNAQNISLIGPGSENFPIRASALVPEGVELTDDLGGEALEVLTSAQTTNFESALGQADRTSPIRSFILDNKDEYTTALQPTLLDLADADDTAKNAHNAKLLERRLMQEIVHALEYAVSAMLTAYGVSQSDNPFLMDRMGLGPTFLAPGVGAGAGAFAGAYAGVGGGATFGAVASAGAGAFAGGGIGIGARPGFGTAAGIGVGASAGLYAPYNYYYGQARGYWVNPRSYGSGVRFDAFGRPINAQTGQPLSGSRTTLGGGGFVAGARAGIGPRGAFSNAYAHQYQGQYGPYGPPGMFPPSLTARNGAIFNAGFGARAGASAFAHANPFVQQGLPGSTSFSTINARHAAFVGGYSGAGASLGFGYNRNIAGSYVGARSTAGASVMVGGAPTVFSFVAAPGTMQNIGVPPYMALQQTQPRYAFSKLWSWP